MVVVAPPVERSASWTITGMNPQPAAVRSESATTVPAEACRAGSAGALSAGAWGSGSSPVQREMRATPAKATTRPAIVRPARAAPRISVANTAVNSGSVAGQVPTTPIRPERSAE